MYRVICKTNLATSSKEEVCMRPRVFLIEETHLDISKLKNFGRIHYVFTVGEDRRPMKDTELDKEVLQKLQNAKFDPNVDYIALIGQVAMLSFFVSSAVATYGTVTSLVFDARNEDYFARELGTTVFV